MNYGDTCWHVCSSQGFEKEEVVAPEGIEFAVTITNYLLLSNKLQTAQSQS